MCKDSLFEDIEGKKGSKLWKKKQHKEDIFYKLKKDNELKIKSADEDPNLELEEYMESRIRLNSEF